MKAYIAKLTKKELIEIIIGKTVGEMQRLVKQYDFKFLIDKYDGVVTDVPHTSKNKTIHVEIENNIVIKAV